MPAPESTLPNGNSLSDDDIGNSHFALSKAVGVDPTNYFAVQVWRKEVMYFGVVGLVMKMRIILRISVFVFTAVFYCVDIPNFE
jgi:hypothetical protein